MSKSDSGALDSLFCCGIHVSRGRLLSGRVPLPPSAAEYATTLAPIGLRRVGQWGFSFIGIGFALVKQLVAVDIEFTLLARPHRPLSTLGRWGFSLPPLPWSLAL